MSDAAQSRELYRRLAASYDRDTRYISGIRRKALAALALQPGETVLDAGCGTGWCLPALAAGVAPGGRVIGFEPSADMLAIARERIRTAALGAVTLLEADAEQVRLPTDTRISAVLFSYTHDLLQSSAALANLFAQLEPGTRIVATGTQLFPAWFLPGNAFLRWSHRVTITDFTGFERPWLALEPYCSEVQVTREVPGSRYLFRGRLSGRAGGVRVAPAGLSGRPGAP